MRCILCRNNSPENHLNKELTHILNTNIFNKSFDPFDTLTPVILISGVSANTTVGVNYVMLNYGNKDYYYYVDNIRFTTNGLYEFKLRFDSLMTYKEDILKQTALVSRQEYEYNMFLPDNSLKTTQVPIVTQKLFPYGFDTDSYILVVQG